ncbi:MAG: methyltransferase domain-containing protein, partial [Actinomycetota bacterium]
MTTQMEGRKLETTVYNHGPQAYEAQLVPRIFRPWAERLVGAANLMAGERVLDLACGTGIVARTAAPRVGPRGTVVGVDVNPAMLDLARSLTGDSIEFVESNAQDLPFEDSSFDVAFCQQGLQFFTDRLAALREVYRVITPRGRAVFAIWRGLEHHLAMDTMDRVVARYLPAEALEGSDAPFWLGDLEQVRTLFASAGFARVYIRTHISEIRFRSAGEMLNGLTGAHAPVAGAIAALDDEIKETMYREMADAFATYTDDDGVLFPRPGRWSSHASSLGVYSSQLNRGNRMTSVELIEQGR